MVRQACTVVGEQKTDRRCCPAKTGNIAPRTTKMARLLVVCGVATLSNALPSQILDGEMSTYHAIAPCVRLSMPFPILSLSCSLRSWQPT